MNMLGALALSVLFQGGTIEGGFGGTKNLNEEGRRLKEKDLTTAYQKKYEKVTQFVAEGTIERHSNYGLGPSSGSFTLLVTLEAVDEEHPAAIRWDGDEVNGKGERVQAIWRVHKDKALEAYPRERLVYELDLGRTQNIPFLWYFFYGPTGDLERTFDITVNRAPSPEPDDSHKVVDPGDEKKSASGLTAHGVGPYTENIWDLDLQPRSGKLQEEIGQYTVFLDPQTLLPKYMHVMTPAEMIKITFTKCEPAPEPLKPEQFDVDTEGFRIEKR